MRVAILLFCSVFVYGQSTSSLPASPGESAANADALSTRESERVRLSEILIATPQPYDPAQVAEAQHKADELHDAIRRGGGFADVARSNSQGPTAAKGGDLGYFKHGALAPALDEVVFRMRVGDVSDVLRTEPGFVILQVTERDFGLGAGTHGRQLGSLDILSDTRGVDFGPYLERVLQNVKWSWYHLIPESIAMKKGKLAIEFAIAKDGQLAGMKLVPRRATCNSTAPLGVASPTRTRFRICRASSVGNILPCVFASITTQIKAISRTGVPPLQAPRSNVWSSASRQSV